MDWTVSIAIPKLIRLKNQLNESVCGARIGNYDLNKGVAKSFYSFNDAFDEASDDSVTDSFEIARIRLLLLRLLVLSISGLGCTNFV